MKNNHCYFLNIGCLCVLVSASRVSQCQGICWWPIAGADPEFLEGGFKSTKGGSFSTFYLISYKFPHDENEIIWSQRGVRVNPRTPSKSATALVLALHPLRFLSASQILFSSQ